MIDLDKLEHPDDARKMTLGDGYTVVHTQYHSKPSQMRLGILNLRALTRRILE